MTIQMRTSQARRHMNTHIQTCVNINPLASILPTVAPLKTSPRHLHAVPRKRLSAIEVICKQARKKKQTIHMQHMIILCVQTQEIIEIK